jgi:hypothetical protein
LELLDSRLSAIGAWYEDSSWADGIQQQLAAIEQAFATGMQQQQQQQPAGSLDQQQDGEASLQAAAAAAAACSSELLWSHSSTDVQLGDASPQQLLQPAAADAEAVARPAAKAYVTTPSGHVSMISSRRGTQVLSALDVAISSSRRATMVESMSGTGRRSRPRTSSGICTMRATAEAVAAAADDCSSCGNAAAGGAATGPAAGAGAVPARCKARRSTLGAVARASCVYHPDQQQELACEQPQQQQPGTLLVLSEAAQRLSAEQEEEEQQQQQLWQHAAAVDDGPSHSSSEPLVLLDDSSTAGDGGYGAADAFEECISQLPAEQEAGWSPVAAALVDAMQQAALAVLTQQHPLSPIAEHEQPQQELPDKAPVSSAVLLQQQQQQVPIPAPEALASEVGPCKVGPQQVESSVVDGEDAFWDAEEQRQEHLGCAANQIS